MQQNKKQGQYPISPSDAKELYRLATQDELLNSRFLFVPTIQKPMARILDVACGTGGWLRKMARRFPHAELVGLDKSDLLLGHARDLAEGTGLSQIVYKQGDFFDLPRMKKFDVIHMRCAAWFLGSRMREIFVNCKQLLVPQGQFCVSDFEQPFLSNSEAMNELSRNFIGALDTDYISMDAIAPLLLEIGFAQIEESVAELDLSANAPDRAGFIHDMETVLSVFRTKIISGSQLSEDAYDDLAQQCVHDLHSTEYIGTAKFRTIIARNV